MAADLQEPPELVEEMFRTLETGSVDITVGTRIGRDDPRSSRWASAVFWRLYRKLIQKEVPPGGVDIFGCNRAVRDQLLEIREANTSLVGLLFWGRASAASSYRIPVYHAGTEKAVGRSDAASPTSWTVFSASLTFRSGC